MLTSTTIILFLIIPIVRFLIEGLKMITVKYQENKLDDVEVFYREAGNSDAPTILLLHGFPTSSHMYRNVIPELAKQFHVIAPDLPGFGYSKVLNKNKFEYSFDNLYRTMQTFIDELNLKHFAMMVFDYGAPIGFRLAQANPEKITAIISQNGNAYEEGLLGAWDPIKNYWQHPSDENRQLLTSLLTEDFTRLQYFHGTPENRLNTISPDVIAHDQAILDRDHEIQLDLFGDYKSNVELYPQWQQYFRDYQPPLLATWGKHDPFFGPAGAKAYQRDLVHADVHLYDAGHFALESHGAEITAVIIAFLNTHLL